MAIPEFKKANASNDVKDAKPELENTSQADAGNDEEFDEIPEETLEPVKAPAKNSGKKKVQETSVEKTAVSPDEEMIGDLIEDRRFQLREKAIATREALAAQVLVKTMIPRAENEAKDATQSYNINGFGFYIRKGVFQFVPEQVAQMISDTYGQDNQIVNEHPLNLKNNKAAAREFSR